MTPAATASLSGLFDDAAMYPPSSAPVEAALAHYRSAGQTTYAWTLGRFLVPAANLTDLAPALDVLWPEAASVRVGVTCTPDQLAALRLLDERLALDTIELRGDLDRVDEVLDAWTPLDALVVVEVPVAGQARDEVERPIARLAKHAAAASVAVKVRCGGTAEPPRPEALAAFLVACSTYGLSFKATAGLHHPFSKATRAGHPYGFVNLLTATALAVDAPFERVTCALVDEEASAFVLVSHGLMWRDRLLGTDELEAARRTLVSIGTCSFLEPISELRAAGWLA